MKITFGMYLDGAQWSEKPASLGEIVCGPASFLALLEQRTGLAGIPVSAPERIDAYRSKIKSAKPAWCQDSFRLDDWSTASRMLALRDELFLNGWNGSAAPSKRLEALALVERTPLPLPPGLPERMQLLLETLKHFKFSDTLILQDDRPLLPWLWEKIITRLEKCGMKVICQNPETPEKPETIRVTGNNEYVLAVELARFLRAGDNKSVALICEGKSATLDGTLHTFGKGMIGNAQSSRWRESLQILPLWLETLWKPFNPSRFMELLTLPCSPIPAHVAKALARALQNSPGIGGEAWEAAWENTLCSIRENRYGIYEDIEEECKKVLQLREFLETESFNYGPDTGVPEKTLIKRCELLEKRLMPRIGTHQELAAAVAHAQILKKIAAGKGIISKVALARLLDSIISTGTAPENNCREVTDFAVFTHPGMVTGKFDTVLWWNCVDRGHTKNVNWSADEIKVLPGYSGSKTRLLESSAWQKARNAAVKEFITFSPQSIAGEPVYPHPLLDDPEIAQNKPLTPEMLMEDKHSWHLGSRRMLLSYGMGYSAPTNAFERNSRIVIPRTLSYSQLSVLLSCPRQWFFKDYLELNTPASMTLPTGGKMIGTMAHKVVELLYTGREKISESDAGKDAAALFDRLLPAMAAELLQPGRTLERERLKKALVDAVISLVREINKRNLLVKECEKPLSGTFNGVDFIGFCDLYLEDAEGTPFVIDMKWSSDSSYEKNLKENKALQLATYSWLLSPEDLDVRCAYYLFPKKKLLCNPDARWDQLWLLACQSWEQRMEELRKGELAKGISDEKELEDSSVSLPLTAGCKFCDFGALCKILEQ